MYAKRDKIIKMIQQKDVIGHELVIFRIKRRTMSTLPIEDMSNTFIEHSFIINNFVVMIGRQIKDSLCRALGDNVQYQWRENDDKIIIPDASINCNTRDRKNVSLTGIPRMIMEVISESTENYDRGEKKISTRKQVYRNTGLWIGEKTG